MIENKSMLNNMLDDSELEDVVGGQENFGAGQKMHACPGGTFGKIVETNKFTSGGYKIYKCQKCGAEGKLYPMRGDNLFRIV